VAYRDAATGASSILLLAEALMTAPREDGTVCTFYSYKGGVGRTLALANIAVTLARWGYSVLCVDWDLEAPGLEDYFKRLTDQSRASTGLLDVIETFSAARPQAWEEAVVEVDLDDDGQLDILPAGSGAPTYIRRLQAIDWERFYEAGLGGFIEGLRSDWKTRYDFVLIDSRTGVTDIGGICTVQLPDVLIAMFTANDQSIEGVLDVVGRAARERDRLPVDRAALRVVPVVSRFESAVEQELTRRWLERIETSVADVLTTWRNREVETGALLNHLRIPYVARWSFGEELPVLDEDGADPLTVTYALETLSALLANDLEHTDVLVANRETYVDAAQRAAPSYDEDVPEFPYAVYLSYRRKDAHFAQELRGALITHGLSVLTPDDAGPAASSRGSDRPIVSQLARHLVAVISDGTSRWAEEEYLDFIRASISDGPARVVVPVLLGDKTAVPASLRAIQPVEPRGRLVDEVALDVVRPIEEQEFTDALKRFGPDAPETLNAMTAYGVTLLMLGELAGARSILEVVADRLVSIFGIEDPRTLDATTALAATLARLGDTREAIELQTAALAAYAQLRGLRDRSTLDARARLALMHIATGDFAAAIEHQRAVVEGKLAVLGPSHSETLEAMSTLAGTLRLAGALEEAQHLQAEVFEARRAQFGENHPTTLGARAELAQTLLEAGRSEEAAALRMTAPDEVAVEGPTEDLDLGDGAATRPDALAPAALRARVIELVREYDEVGVSELLKRERRVFVASANDAIARAVSDHPTPTIDFERMGELERELVAMIDRRVSTMLPLAEYAPGLFTDECSWLGELADADWRFQTPYAEWQQSPRWLSWFMTYELGAVATRERRFPAVRELWDTSTEDGTPLPAIKLLAAHQFALALVRARAGAPPRLGELWHVGAAMTKSDVIREFYPETAGTLEQAIQSLGDFSFIVTLLAAREDLEVVQWWPATGASLPARVQRDARLRRELAADLFKLPEGEDLTPERIDQWLSRAKGPRVEVI
jgi:MinD-like ATPase involved in chromosome partitioning or flagellar assembly/tetratricopeptide (TPR) repeat protein